MTRVTFALLLLALAVPAHAATIAAVSCDRTEVVSKIALATTGDTVTVPACAATAWSSQITIAKAITLQGAGIGITTITTNGVIINGVAARVTGFTFNEALSRVEGAIGFRFDHNAFIGTTGFSITIYPTGTSTGPSEGLIDHCTFSHSGTSTTRAGAQYGQYSGTANMGYRWSEPLDIGLGHAIYMEDNDMTYTGTQANALFMDGNYGSRMVARFNVLRSSRFEQHTKQSDSVDGARLWELYENTMTNPRYPTWSAYRPFFIRGGTGVIFHNTSDGQFSVNSLDIDSERSYTCACDGTVAYDGNTPGYEGWPCRNQIGRSTNASRFVYPASPAPVESWQPAYFWRNTQPSGEIPVRLNPVGSCYTRMATLHLLANRDYFSYVAPGSFDGSSGVTEGLLADRPATCSTTGVGYWATDQGEWNSTHAGADGQLYVCSGGAWVLYYTPYTYPHPLQSAPSAPTNVMIR